MSQVTVFYKYDRLVEISQARRIHTVDQRKR
jgi:hypothetical protein